MPPARRPRGEATGDDQHAGADEHSNDNATDDDGVDTVHLVGSGPGDPELLMMRTARLIDEADVVLHDKLPGPKILEMIPVEKCEGVGKCAGGEWAPQKCANTRLVELAREGKDVVRLKGGDSFVFGHGDEEVEHFADSGTLFEVVPGITSAAAGAGAVDILVTHHDHVSPVSFVIGHKDPTKGESAVDWDVPAATGGTLVVFMSVGKFPFYTAKLREAGLAGDVSVILIERATWPDMYVATGTFDTIVDVHDETDTESPAIIVIGEIAATRDRVKGFLQGGGVNAIEMGADANPISGDAGGDE